MNVKENLKYRSTHKAIMNAALELLEEKELRQITVAEVCRRVGINRTTFYLHFKDVPDVLEKIAGDVNTNVSQIIPTESPTKEDFLRLFAHVQENRAFYLLLFRQGLPFSMQSKLFPSESHTPPQPGPKIIKLMERRNIHSLDQLEYHHAMFQASLNALLRRWLERDCKETPEELCEILWQEYLNVP